MVKLKCKLIGITINGTFIGVAEDDSISLDMIESRYKPTIGDLVDFKAGDTWYTGGVITDIIDGIPYVNEIKLGADMPIHLTPRS